VEIVRLNPAGTALPGNVMDILQLHDNDMKLLDRDVSEKKDLRHI
jgi:hypothetical protein